MSLIDTKSRASFKKELKNIKIKKIKGNMHHTIISKVHSKIK